MIDRERVMPALTVSTVATHDPRPLVDRLPHDDHLLWLRKGEGMVGFGSALRWEFEGPDRMAQAARAWRDLAQRATIVDAVGVPGTGLVAFGTFAFADESAASSVLIVPRVIVGHREGRSWQTTVTVQGEAEPAVAGAPHAAATHSGGSPDAGHGAGPTVGPDAGPVRFDVGELAPEAYLAAVARAIVRIRAGELEKVVLARDLVGRLPHGASLSPALDTLARGYPDCWTFAVDGLFGSSPETLVTVFDGAVSARVLAGSAARGTDTASDLAASVGLATSAKDQDEHEYAVQSVLAALRPHSPAVTASEVPFTLRLPNLWHLASDVEGTLTDHSGSLDLAAALHPTAAVAGTPTREAVAAIAQLEHLDRGRYAGPVGWIGADGDGEWAIALRCAQLEAGGILRAFAGAGIVDESIPERELAETTMKFRPIVEAFAP